jgi:ubiquitin-protein ligase
MLFRRRVYHLQVDRDFPFSSPKIHFIKDLHGVQSPEEIMTIDEFWKTTNNLALAVICYDYMNYVNLH